MGFGQQHDGLQFHVVADERANSSMLISPKPLKRRFRPAITYGWLPVLGLIVTIDRFPVCYAPGTKAFRVCTHARSYQFGKKLCRRRSSATGGCACRHPRRHRWHHDIVVAGPSYPFFDVFSVCLVEVEFLIRITIFLVSLNCSAAFP